MAISLPKFTVYLNFQDGNGFVDITEQTLTKEMYRENYLWNNLKPTTNMCSFKIKHKTEITNLLVNSSVDVWAKISATYNYGESEEYTESWFEGIVQKNFSIKSTSRIDWIDIQIVDFTESLKKRISNNISLKYTNTRQLIQILLLNQELGRMPTNQEIEIIELHTGFWNVVSMNTPGLEDTNLVITYFNYDTDDNKTYYDLISEICYESRLVFFTKPTEGDTLTKRLQPTLYLYQLDYPWIETLGNPTIDLVSDIQVPHFINKKSPVQDSIQIEYYTRSLVEDQVLFIDSTNRSPITPGSTCTIPVASGAYFPINSTSTGDVEIEYSIADYEQDQILAVFPNGTTGAAPTFIPPKLTATTSISGSILTFIDWLKTNIGDYGTFICYGDYNNVDLSNITFNFTTEKKAYSYWKQTSTYTTTITTPVKQLIFVYDPNYPPTFYRQVWVTVNVKTTINHYVDTLYERTPTKYNWTINIGGNIYTTSFEEAGSWVVTSTTRDIINTPQATTNPPPTPSSISGTETFPYTGTIEFYSGETVISDDPSVGIEFIGETVEKSQIIYATPTNETFQPAFNLVSGYPILKNTSFITKYRNVSSLTKNVLKFKVTGSVVLKEGPNNVFQYITGTTSDRLLTIKSDYLYTVEQAEKLADTLLSYYKGADYTYTFTSKNIYSPGDIYWITDPNFPFLNRKVVCTQVKNTVYKAKNEYVFEGIYETDISSGSNKSNDFDLDLDIQKFKAPSRTADITSSNTILYKAPKASTANDFLETLISYKPSKQEVIETGWNDDYGTTIPIPPTIYLCQGDFRTIHIGWSRQEDLTNLKCYHIQVSANGIDWFKPAFGLNWGEDQNSWFTVYPEYFAHPRIPHAGDAPQPLFYRLRAVTKQDVVSDWTNIISATTFKIEDTDRATTNKVYLGIGIVSLSSSGSLDLSITEIASGSISISSDTYTVLENTKSISGSVTLSSNTSYISNLGVNANINIGISSGTIYSVDYNAYPLSGGFIDPYTANITMPQVLSLSDNSIITQCKEGSVSNIRQRSYTVSNGITSTGVYGNIISLTTGKVFIDSIKISSSRFVSAHTITGGTRLSLFENYTLISYTDITTDITSGKFVSDSDLIFVYRSGTTLEKRIITISGDSISISTSSLLSSGIDAWDYDSVNGSEAWVVHKSASNYYYINNTILSIANASTPGIKITGTDQATVVYKSVLGLQAVVYDFSSLPTISTAETIDTDGTLGVIWSSDNNINVIYNTSGSMNWNSLEVYGGDVYLGTEVGLDTDSWFNIGLVSVSSNKDLVYYTSETGGYLKYYFFTK